MNNLNATVEFSGLSSVGLLSSSGLVSGTFGSGSSVASFAIITTSTTFLLIPFTSISLIVTFKSSVVVSGTYSRFPSAFNCNVKTLIFESSPYPIAELTSLSKIVVLSCLIAKFSTSMSFVIALFLLIILLCAYGLISISY